MLFISFPAKPKCPFHKDKTKSKQFQEVIQTHFTQFAASICFSKVKPSLWLGFEYHHYTIFPAHLKMQQVTAVKRRFIGESV